MKKMIKILLIIVIVLILTVIIINLIVKSTTQKQILTENEASKLEDVDCILVLGAGIWGNKPSPMLEDRLLEAISLYEN